MDVNFQNPGPARDQGLPAPRRGWRQWLGVFNLNDPRWGRDDNGKDAQDPKAPDEPRNTPQRPTRGQGPNQGPPDLDELWRDFNRKLSGLFGGRGPGRSGCDGGGGGPSFQPDMKSAGIGVGLIRKTATL